MDAPINARSRDQGDDPAAHVPGVHDLYRPVHGSWREDVAAARDPFDPPGEAEGVVVWPDDVGWPDDRGPVGAEQLGREALPGNLEAAVGLVGDLLGGRIRELGERRVLVEPGRDRGLVRRRGRDVDVVSAAPAERLR